jgi:Protein of unknown function (DUF1217)
VLTAAAGYRIISSDIARSLEATAKKPDVARETAYYLDNIGEVKSIDDFLADSRLFSYAMKAFGLGEMTYARAFMRKVLSEGVDHGRSFANSLADPRYRQFAETFNFARYGEATTSFQRAQQGTVDAYVRQTLEEDAGRQNEGVRLALYFQRKAPGISSVYNILGDRALLTVVQTALGLSPLTAAADIEKQAEMISKRLDIADLKDPVKLQKFIDRFVSLWEVANPSASPGPAAILIGQPVEFGIRPDLLATLQNLKQKGS